MAPRSFPVRVTSVPHAGGGETHVFFEVGTRLFGAVVSAAEAPRPVAPHACPLCGGDGETVTWVHGEDAPSSTGPCSWCRGSGERP